MTKKASVAPLIQSLQQAPQAVAAWITGVSVRTLRDATDAPRNGDGSYNIRSLIGWRIAKERAALAINREDPLMYDDTDSPGLERYRTAKAQLAELDVAERQRSVLRRDQVRDALGRFASILRRLGERLGKRFGPEATKLFNRALDDCQRLVDSEFGDAKEDPQR